MGGTLPRGTLTMATREIFYQSDHVTAVLQDFGTETVFVSFNEMNLLGRGDVFWGHELFARTGISAIGIVTATPNWYPVIDMVAIADLVRERLRGKRVVTYGFSQGGYGALKFASLFGASLALGLSPQWSINPADVGGADDRYTEFHDPLLRNGERIEAHDLCAANFMLYDPAHAQDRFQAAALAKLGVVPVIVPFSDHFTAVVLTEGRQGRALVALCSSGEAVSARALRQLMRACRAGSRFYRAQKIAALLASNSRHGGFLRRELDQLPEGVDRARHMTHFHVAQRDFAAAQAALETLSDADLLSFDFGVYWAIFHHSNFTYGEARLARLLKVLYCDHVGVRLNGVTSMVRFGWRDEALAEMDALAGLPGAAANLTRFIELYVQLGRADLAAQVSAAIRQNQAQALPQRIRTGFELAGIWRAHQARPQLFHELCALEQLCAASGPDLLRIAELHIEISEFGFAERLIDQALKLDPDDRQAELLLASIAARSGQTELAASRIARLLDAPLDRPELWLSLSRLAQESGDMDGAVRAARAARLLDPSFWEARARLADLLIATGRTAAAIAELGSLRDTPAIRSYPALICSELAQRAGASELAVEFATTWHRSAPHDLGAALARTARLLDAGRPGEAETVLLGLTADLEAGRVLERDQYRQVIEVARRVNYPTEARVLRAAAATFPDDLAFRDLQRRDSFAQMFYAPVLAAPPRKASLLARLGLRRA